MHFIMSKKEVERYQIIKRSLERELTVKDAAKLGNLSERQVYRIRTKVRKKGPEGLIHRNRGRESNNKIKKEEKDKIGWVIKQKYHDFWPGHAAEKLEHHGIYRSPETIRKIMIEKELWKPRQRKTSDYRAKRPPRKHFGEMALLDGSYHDWFEGRDAAGKCCLLLFVDDATSTILSAKFVESENLKDIYFSFREYLLTRGKPKTIYTDGLRVYHNNLMEEESERRLTQFKMSLKELDVELIRAYSPEAKGKVETVFGLLQNRLIKEMRLKGILNKERGNKYLEEEFIPRYNERYGRAPEKKGNFHRHLSGKEKESLSSILSEKTTRVVQNNFCISYKNKTLQLLKKQPATVRKREKVVIEEHMDSSVWIKLREKYLNYQEITAKREALISDKDVPWILAANTKEENKKVEANSN